eukprot:Filipodium_phascolosomae@DN2393_c0_g1_i2.p2
MTETRSFKCVLLGDASVGKSSIVMRFVGDTFSDSMETTIGAAFSTQTIQLEDCTIKFEIWDTAGQERFQSLAPMYYRGAAAAVVVYDQSKEHTFNRAQFWIQQLQQSTTTGADMVIALAANKKDLPEKAIPIEIAQNFADENKLVFMETSAKSGQNVYNLFEQIAVALKEVHPSSSRANHAATGSGTLKLTEHTENPGRQGSSCC